MRKKSHHLNIYKLKNEIKSISDVELPSATPPFELESEDLHGKLKHRLFIQKNLLRKPKWCELLEPLLNKSKNKIITSTSSFILFIQHDGNLYALTGGYSHTKIKNFIDEDFGLHMALRLINPNAITSLMQKAIKGSTKQIYRAVVGYRPDLDFENYNRFLRAIQGKSVDKELGVHVSGKASLSFTTKLQFSDFNSLFTKIEEIYNKPALTTFPKSYTPVIKSELIEILNGLLLSEINNFLNTGEDRDKLYLEFKDLFEQFKCSTFFIKIGRYTEEIGQFFSLEIIREKILQQDINRFDSLEDLSKIKLSGVTEEGYSVFKNESIVNLLVYEVDYEGSSFIFLDKKWDKIYDDFKATIDNEVKEIETLTNFMPDWDYALLADPKGEPEYNVYVGEQKKWVVLDRDFIKMKDSTKIEVCDLYDKENRRFIHVKRVWGSKASYLFAQGLVSGILNHRSAEFRNECAKKWTDLFDGKYRKGDNIVFALADNKALSKDFPNNLTFFSKINLAQVVSDLWSLGYKVSLAPVKIVKAENNH